jgi:hypothetical protein
VDADPAAIAEHVLDGPQPRPTVTTPSSLVIPHLTELVGLVPPVIRTADSWAMLQEGP